MYSADFTGLAEEATRDHANLRHIVSLLYHEDMAVRLRAALALGEVTRRDPQLMLQRWVRIFRSFDDTMSCWGVSEALSEIARNLPRQQRGTVVNFLKGFRRDDCSCQGYLWGMCRICMIESERVHEFAAELETYLASPNICMQGQALWALGELAVKAAAPRVEGFLNNENEIWIFEHETVAKKSLGTIAAEGLKKMQAA